MRKVEDCNRLSEQHKLLMQEQSEKQDQSDQELHKIEFLIAQTEFESEELAKRMKNRPQAIQKPPMA
jgi:hypothetical protein